MMMNTTKHPEQLSLQEKRDLLGREILENRTRKNERFILPNIEPSHEKRNDPFPLTALQQAYWAGRSADFELGNVTGHCYLELECGRLDLNQFTKAWQQLIDRHDMLRAIILPDGKQQILQQVPAYHFTIHDLREEDDRTIAAKLKTRRRQMSHQFFKLDKWPLFELCASLLPGMKTRLHFSLDSIIADGWSISILIRELVQYYRNPEYNFSPLDISFRDYVDGTIELKETKIYQRAKEYWNSRLSTLPSAPKLPLKGNSKSLIQPWFERKTAELDSKIWKKLKTKATQAGLSSSIVLCSLYTAILSRWSNSTHFCISVPHQNRLPLHPQVNNLVGSFASILLLEVKLVNGSSFESHAYSMQQQLMEDLKHGYYSGIDVLRKVGRFHGRNSEAIMPVVFTSMLPQNGKDTLFTSLGDLGNIVYTVTQTPQVALDLHVTEREGNLLLDLYFVEDLFPGDMLDDMFDTYYDSLNHLTENKKYWHGTIHELIQPERIVERSIPHNTSEMAIPKKLLQTLFADQVPVRPHQKAVVTSDRTLTYQELYMYSNHLARHLRELGARPNQLVAVVMEKGWEQVVAVLGILSSGAAYLPIDSELPEERLWYILENSEAEFILTQSCIDARQKWPKHIHPICVDNMEFSHREDIQINPVQTPEDLAFVIYTSGSTGLPKGAMIAHEGVVNAIICTNTRFQVGENDRSLALTSLHHDMSVYDIFGILAAGGTIVMPDAWGRRDPAHWADLLEKEQVTIWNSVPALMEMFVEYVGTQKEKSSVQYLRLVFMGGDWIPVTLPNRLKTIAEEAQVVSVGGPTETTLWNIWYPIKEVDPNWTSIPYGRPIANTQYYVLNNSMEECPVWVEGELCCAGIGLAKGYWRDDETTRKRFIVHSRTGERIYRTGDMGRFLPDGNIEFLGRKDFQVQINGHRIELAEIETSLVQHEKVSSTVVIAIGERQHKKHLVAYVVADRDSETPTNSELRRYLRTKLPEYMVPQIFIFMESLPLNSNGKIDRTALPQPDPTQTISGAPGQNGSGTFQINKRIIQVVNDVMNVDNLPIDENLTDLGATSVDMIRIANQLESEFGFRPRMDEFFHLKSIAGLGRYFEQHLGTKKPESVRGELRDFASQDRKIKQNGQSALPTFEPLIEMSAREEFRKRQPGIRRDLQNRKTVRLSLPKSVKSLEKEFAHRRSRRHFSPTPLSHTKFSSFLSCLRQISLAGNPKYLYASGGGLYPIQTYLYIKSDRVEQVPSGTYYYHPIDHSLVLIEENAPIERTVYWPSNRPIFDEAAFAIFLIAQLSAIGPMYGEESVHLATIEAGLISQLLEMKAWKYQVGICQIGSLDFSQIRNSFALEENQVIIHSLVGGHIQDSPDGKSERVFSVPYQTEPSEILNSNKRNGHGDFPIAIHVKDLRAEAVLEPDIYPVSTAETQVTKPSHIFLTGSTGFLGSFLLHELLRQTEAQVHCLVRASDIEEGRQRIQRSLQSNLLPFEHLNKRVTPIPGDLTKPYFGLSEEDFQLLANQVEVIYHSGAWVNWVYPYQILKPTNVQGTCEVLRLANLLKVKPVHFISSLSVFPFNGISRKEQSNLDYDDLLYGGYAQSKWVSERLMTIAKLRGFPVNIYRPSIITGQKNTGVFNTNAYLESLIKGCIQIKNAPELDTFVDMVPVDYVSESIVHLSLQADSILKVFHFANPKPLHMYELLDWIESFGYPLNRLPHKEWKKKLFSTSNFRENALYPFAGFLAELEEYQTIIPQHECSNTLQGLANTSIECPPVDSKLLSTYFAYFIRNKFIDAP